MERRAGASRILRLGAVALVSTILALLLCEAGLRLLDRQGGAPPLAAGSVERYVTRLPVAPGTDRKWFMEDPPPLPNRHPVTPERQKLYDEYARRGVYVHEADQVWNRYFVESQRCAPATVFQRHPPTLRVFDPPVMGPYPRYRFLPGITTAGHMVTNEFGLRGPPLDLVKPPGTIRIAFLGASTTVSQAYFPFSYPERVVDWLNRFAGRNRLGVRFEVLNSGRYGMMSNDIAAIVRDELLALDPDLAVFYEGANHFFSANGMVDPPIKPRRQIDPQDPITTHRVPELLRANLRIADLTDRALNGFSSFGEPRKPRYRLKWPEGVDEGAPDFEDANLPLDLPRVFADLDAMRRSLESIGSRLVMSSFVWFAAGDVALSPVRHKYIYEQLNTMLWPLRYGDIRRLADFQNRAYQRWAAARKLDFADVAASFPQDPDLFVDGVHMTESGERLRAWIVFQELVPIVRRMIASGELPRRTDPARLPRPPSLAWTESTTRCGDPPSTPLVKVRDAVALETMAASYDPAEVRFARPLEVVTGPEASGYAGVLPIHIPWGLPGPHYVMLRARVMEGQVAGGILERTADGKRTDPINEKLLTPAMGAIEVYIPVFSPDRTDRMVIANAAAGGVRSRVVVEDVALMAPSQPPDEIVVHVVDLERIKAADPKAAIERVARGLSITAKPERWSYAARGSLGFQAGGREGMTVRVRARALEGHIGLRILDRAGQEALVDHSLWPSDRMVDVILPLPAQDAGDLVITNVAVGNVTAKAIVERIEIRAPR